MADVKTKLIEIEGSPSEGEWRRIASFKERAAEFISTFQVIKKQYPGIIHGAFHRNTDGTYGGGIIVPKMHDLKVLFLDFRLLYAEREPANFRVVANILYRNAKNELVKAFVTHIKSKAVSSIVEDGFFKMDGKSLKCNRLIDLWFNAKIFHSDREKQEELQKLTNILSNEVVVGLLFIAIYDFGLAIKNLSWAIADYSSNNKYIKIPRSYVDDYNESISV
jgi:hypothetical protein